MNIVAHLKTVSWLISTDDSKFVTSRDLSFDQDPISCRVTKILDIDLLIKMDSRILMIETT